MDAAQCEIMAKTLSCYDLVSRLYLVLAKALDLIQIIASKCEQFEFILQLLKLNDVLTFLLATQTDKGNAPRIPNMTRPTEQIRARIRHLNASFIHTVHSASI